MIKLSSVLKTLRKSQNLTQTELAKRCGVKQQSVAAWEKGKAYPDMRAFYALRETLRVSADYLIDGETSTAAPLTQQDKKLLEDFHCLDSRGQKDVLDTVARNLSYIKPTVDNHQEREVV